MRETPAAFIRRLRIERSLKSLLHDKNANITDIALDSGFSSSANFSKAMKIHVGLSPIQCRRMGYRKLVRMIGNRQRAAIDMECRRWRETLDSASFRTRDESRLLYLRYQGKFDFKLGLHWMKFIGLAGKRNLLAADAEIFGIGHDNPDFTPSGKTIYDACVTVREKTDDPLLSFQTIPAAEYAVFPFKGHFRDIPRLYALVYGKWMPDNGLEPADGSVLQKIKRPPRGPALDMDIFFPVLRRRP